MFYMKSKKIGKNEFMSINVDMTKAYDRVEQTMLHQILYLHGFIEKFCNLIKERISTPHFLALINGSPTGFFQFSRGIRQGIQFLQPCSPYFQQTVKASPSIWPGIRRCYESLRKGIYVKMDRNSVANIWDNPRLHHLPNFMLPTEFNVNHQLIRIGDLMYEDGINQDYVTVSNNFPDNIRDVILNTLIYREQDSLFRLPLSQRDFL